MAAPSLLLLPEDETMMSGASTSITFGVGIVPEHGARTAEPIRTHVGSPRATATCRQVLVRSTTATGALQVPADEAYLQENADSGCCKAPDALIAEENANVQLSAVETKIHQGPL